MASKVRPKFFSPYVDEKILRSLQKRVSPRKTSQELEASKEKQVDKGSDSAEKTGSDEQPSLVQQTEKTVQGESMTSKKAMIKVNVNEWYQKRTAELGVKPIYKTLPNAKTALEGEKPEPRFIWKEKNWPKGFPDSPEEAKTDVMTFLEQRDCYRRLQTLKVKDFCVGSIVAVTRSDPHVAKGQVRFVGICIYKSRWQNTLGATFTLRNVIEGEPMEINFQLYSPLIQSIEVIKHERREEDALFYLRDYPPSMSMVNEKMKALPYTEEPSLYVESEETKKEIDEWFAKLWRLKKRF
ncbi:39S ribosomal protein L19, mitochondrial-like [Orbicella faveolata]|uniref:39S ribosomal protein L19, mitochondrial-like n=1 Tax=Orbicella faveolata TaxID=48498 RepID=UPI0009E2C5CE|nr:39S ribosomal protein L19, mitochondrial-like [Orbicella faveolata]